MDEEYSMKFTNSVLMGAVTIALFASATPLAALAADKNPFEGLKLRNVSAAFQSGRIADFAFYKGHPEKYIVATASSNLWKTEDNGTTWKPIFDNEGSYAIGVVELAPSDENTIWVGTGENNSQRSVANGDGVYKSVDGGKNWKNMGLKDSGHISQIWINPSDPNHVRVAAQGPLWNEGGDRGLYETTDGGENWNHLLNIDAHTGANEIIVDSNNPDNMVVSTYQRRRHVWTLINGGPGSGIHRTTDGGKTWQKITAGLPSKDDWGRVGLAGSTSHPNVMYAQIETVASEAGIYRSDDFGLTWRKQSNHMNSSPQYYNELVVDPNNPDIIYLPETYSKVSRDGGKTWNKLGLTARHVDDHAVWVDPDNSKHIFIGGDGGVYESWDGGEYFRHIRNLPVTQFYRVQPDNATPFYNVCGGTQDNNTICGPVRTTSVHGITNADWTNVLGGDGFEAVIDPNDPNIIYAQYQYGGLARIDKRTTEKVFIVPQEDANEKQPKWNWNSPLIISPHKSTRLYYAAEKLYRSDDRGDNWKVVSPDLTRQIDRNKLEVMGRVWSVDAIAKNASTSMYGSIIGLSESTLKEGLIFIGSDDGQISVTENGGESWRSYTKFKGVPDMSLVEDIQASLHDENTVFAVFDNHKRGDFKPYVAKSTNKGKSWKLISSNLPKRGTAHSIVQDHVDPNLLFLGTEYGLFFTQNGGASWQQMKGNFPTTSVRDVEIQRRESDLVVGTFGRGIYVLDDYTPLRFKAADVAEKDATLFPVKAALLYLESSKYGGRRKGSMGDQFFTNDNPAFGATFTYYLRDSYETKQELRRASEREIEKEGGDTPYPSWEALKAEDRDEKAQLIFTITDNEGNRVRRITQEPSKGLNRITWNLRLDAPDAVDLTPPETWSPYYEAPKGPLVVPGEYKVSMAVRYDGKVTELAAPQSFKVKGLDNSPEITKNRAAVYAFQKKTTALARAIEAASNVMEEMVNRIKHIAVSIERSEHTTELHMQKLEAIKDQLYAVKISMHGDRTLSSRAEPTERSIQARIGSVIFGHWYSQFDVPGTHKKAYDIAAHQFTEALVELKAIETSLAELEDELDGIGAPWTPGRLPKWPVN